MKQSVTKTAGVFVLFCAVLFAVSYQVGNATIITSTTAGGNWSVSGTWSGGVVPGSGDDVVIDASATVTINASFTINSLTVYGKLQFGTAVNYNCTVNGNVIVTGGSPPSQFIVNGSTNRTHTLTVTGDFDASGAVQVNFYGTASRVVNVTFSGSSNATVSGKINFASVTINKTGGAYVSCSSPGSGNTLVNVSFTFTSGLWKITSGEFEIGPVGSISGADVTKYFSTEGSPPSGYLQRDDVGGTGTLFPVGNGDYTPATIANSGSSSYHFSVNVQNSFNNAPYNTKVVNKQWNVTKSNGTGGVDVTMTLQWNSNGTDNDEVGVYSQFSHADPNDIYMGEYWTTDNQWHYATATLGNPSTGIYTAERSGLTTFSAWGVSNIGGLPVELTSFGATYLNDNVHLTWQTATEVNNAGFYIERYAPSISDKWTDIGFVPGYGVSNTPRSYSFNDNVNAVRQSDLSKLQYRLRQLDRDGSTTYSDVVSLAIPSLSSSIALFQNYPNPFNPATSIAFTLRTPQTISIIVYNSLGEEVRRVFDNAAMGAGEHSIQFDARDLPSGVYYYRLIGSDEVMNKTMTISR